MRWMIIPNPNLPIWLYDVDDDSQFPICLYGVIPNFQGVLSQWEWSESSIGQLRKGRFSSQTSRICNYFWFWIKIQIESRRNWYKSMANIWQLLPRNGIAQLHHNQLKIEKEERSESDARCFHSWGRLTLILTFLLRFSMKFPVPLIMTLTSILKTFIDIDIDLILYQGDNS